MKDLDYALLELLENDRNKWHERCDLLVNSINDILDWSSEVPLMEAQIELRRTLEKVREVGYGTEAD